MSAAAWAGSMAMALGNSSSMGSSAGAGAEGLGAGVTTVMDVELDSSFGVVAATGFFSGAVSLAGLISVAQVKSPGETQTRF